MTSRPILTASTSTAPNAAEPLPVATATPMNAVAGIVVTEIATPTPALALVSNARIAATPAASAMPTVS